MRLLGATGLVLGGAVVGLVGFLCVSSLPVSFVYYTVSGPVLSLHVRSCVRIWLSLVLTTQVDVRCCVWSCKERERPGHRTRSVVSEEGRARERFA